MPAPYSPLAIANYFIERHGADAGGIEHMKLQKLVYLSYGWWLSHFPEPLLTEDPEVWRYGPVFDSLYQVFKTGGREPIREPGRPYFTFRDPPAVDADDNDVRNLLDWIWNKYGKLNSIQLSNITHQPGTPWSEMAQRHGYQVPPHLPMDRQIIARHYRELAERASGENVGRDPR